MNEHNSHIAAQPAHYGRVIGWGMYAPERVITNDELAQRLDTSDEWIQQRTGIRERRVAAADETTSTLAVNAARRALDRAALAPADLDLIVIATSTPDHFAPAVSSIVQDQLGAVDTPAFVLTNGCTGFVYGLVTAQQFIASGAYRTVLVVGVELLSRFMNWDDRSTAVLFGDGAGAFILRATDEPCGVRGFVLGSDGSQHEQLILPAGGSADPFSAEVLSEGRHYLRMNGREVFKFATRVIGPASREALEHSGLALGDIDWIVPHQANQRIIEAAARQMNVPLDRFLINIDRYANTSAASIPLALAEALDDGRVATDDRVLLVAFGAGLTWGAVVLELAPQTAFPSAAPAKALALDGFA